MSIHGIVEAAAAGATERTLEGLLWELWQGVTDAAAEADEQRLDELVALVTGVRETAVEGVKIGGRRLFGDLPVFGAQMREEWNLVPPDDRSVESWTRLNSFAARLTAAGVDFSLFGLWSIGTALETFAKPSEHLPAAVEWFEQCGAELATATRHRRTFGPGPGRLHELAEREGLSEGGYNLPRWTFWLSRLEGLAGGGDPVAVRGLRAARKAGKLLLP
ncbi:DUF3632 domain-containing protein [Paractinoplanes lichenicola]|uniref:DUF3632 domain-containing protein n=1 Tax=Paractinoplanes lichenicola TaxID=2802976 RepID=A0ABS1VLZ4_9ACTN|nr:DUF3632 domain-containing protein [Actinoplanes lichenicola]MBL7255745.1 DUF3632 domain-containing protein [Actinoplanes lichenicola]